MTARRHRHLWATRAAAVAAMVAAALAAAVAGAPPALAAPPTIAFTAPGSNARVTTSATKVDAKVTMADGRLKSISLAVTPLAGGGSPVSAGPVAGNDAPSRDVSFGIVLPFNGRYRAEITATGNDSLLGLGLSADKTTKATRDFDVVAPPARPASVRTAVDAGTRQVTVSWARNNEPDLLFYLVQRSLGGGEYVLAAKTTELSIVDPAPAETGGEFSYQVVAVRAGATEGEGINSNPSAAAAAAVAAPPPTTAPPTSVPPDTTPSSSPGSTAPATSTPATTPATSSPAPSSPAAGPATTIPAGSPGALTRSGSIDLSGLRSLQTQPPPRRVSPPTTADTGFDQTLPFDTANPPQGLGEPEGGAGFDDSVLSETEVGADSELGSGSDVEKTRALAFLAAGLLATVFLMHILWIRGEVARVPLEALPPEGAAGAAGAAGGAAKPGKARKAPKAARKAPPADRARRPRPGARPPRSRPGPDPRLARPRPDREDLPIG